MLYRHQITFNEPKVLKIGPSFFHEEAKMTPWPLRRNSPLATCLVLPCSAGSDWTKLCSSVELSSSSHQHQRQSPTLLRNKLIVQPVGPPVYNSIELGQLQRDNVELKRQLHEQTDIIVALRRDLAGTAARLSDISGTIAYLVWHFVGKLRRLVHVSPDSGLLNISCTIRCDVILRLSRSVTWRTYFRRSFSFENSPLFMR